jgi:hypothetical protein
MRDILKLLNDRSALSDVEFKSFEALCENWRVTAEAELARRQSLPRSTDGSQFGP